MYEQVENLTFGQAVEYLKKGLPVQREGWNGKGLFIFMQVPARISVEAIVPNMQSLPQSVKNIFIERLKVTDKEVGGGAHNHSTIDYKNQLALVYPDNTIYGWSPSTNDSLAADWKIYQF